MGSDGGSMPGTGEVGDRVPTQLHLRLGRETDVSYIHRSCRLVCKSVVQKGSRVCLKGIKGFLEL